jgi:hypothetical protein
MRRGARLAGGRWPDGAAIGTDLEVVILGEPFPAKVIEDSPWAPMNERLRA